MVSADTAVRAFYMQIHLILIIINEVSMAILIFRNRVTQLAGHGVEICTQAAWPEGHVLHHCVTLHRSRALKLCCAV